MNGIPLVTQEFGFKHGGAPTALKTQFLNPERYIYLEKKFFEAQDDIFRYSHEDQKIIETSDQFLEGLRTSELSERGTERVLAGLVYLIEMCGDQKMEDIIKMVQGLLGDT